MPDLGDDAIVRDGLADHQGLTRPECYTLPAAPSSRDVRKCQHQERAHISCAALLDSWNS